MASNEKKVLGFVFILIVFSGFLLMKGSSFDFGRISVLGAGGAEEVEEEEGSWGVNSENKIVLTGVYNEFLQDDGLFSFSYKNNYEVREHKDVYYLRDLSSMKVVFQIFEKGDNMYFDPSLYSCKKAYDSEVCYSRNTPDGIVKDINLVPDLIEYYDSYLLLSRGEALQKLLDLKYPDKDFSQYRGSCFADVSYSDELSGHICYAKNQGLVSGIDGSFWPKNTMNLWGMVRLLFDIFEITDYSVDTRFVDETVFDKISSYHPAYSVLKKAYAEGLFDNPRGVSVWPNRNVGVREAGMMIRNFAEWSEGKEIRNYQVDDQYVFDGAVYMKTFKNVYIPDVCDVEGFENDDEKPSFFMNSGAGVDVYYEDLGGVREFLFSLAGRTADEIADVYIDFGEKKYKINVQVKYNDGEEECYKFRRGQYDFFYLKDGKIGRVPNRNLLPSYVDRDFRNILPTVNIHMSDYDFKSIIEKRTTDDRYPAYLEFEYPDGTIRTRSVMIKTRGNAHRGYVKSSFTIESFVDFEEVPEFTGDEFIDNNDEFKLRSHIADEYNITEKLVYSGFEDMGYPSPDFFEVTLLVNNVPFGLYQVTEPIDKEFFAKRSMNVVDYYYASIWRANLTYQIDDDYMRYIYDIDGDEDRFFEFLRRLGDSEKSLLSEIDIQNVFDYALYLYLVDARDSWEHNFYLYFDEDMEKWRIMIWDGDTAFENVPFPSKSVFKNIVLGNSANYNNLVHFVLSHLNNKQFDAYYSDFRKRWNRDVKMVERLDWYKGYYGDLFNYENTLWNGKFLERKVTEYNTLESLDELRSSLSRIERF